MRYIAIVAALVAIVAGAALAQGTPHGPVGVTRPVERDSMSAARFAIAPAPLSGRWWPDLRSERARRFAPLASALLPGSGQLLLGEDRFLVYAAVEAGFWLKRMNDQADRRRQERGFRLLARDVARSHFSAAPPDGDWQYYETMRRYLESGAFSLSEGSIVPDTNRVTFNGELWVDVRAHNPDSASALAEYRARAIQPDMQWSWRDNQLQWDLFKRGTEQRNAAAGRAAFDLIVIGANHVISMVDAFTTIRLQVRPRGPNGLEIAGSVPWR